MVNSRQSEDFEQVVEKIVFDEEELEELKIAIRNFTVGKIQAKQLKQKLLLCRGRMVKDISNFLSFCIERIRDNSQTQVHQEIIDSNQPDFVIGNLRKEITDRNELLEVVAEKINELVIETKKDTNI